VDLISNISLIYFPYAAASDRKFVVYNALPVELLQRVQFLPEDPAWLGALMVTLVLIHVNEGKLRDGTWSHV
jgi:hypothetical protein